MPRSISRKRPWLAALLAAILTGFGHLYLRRWRRALGWFAASVAVSALFVDPAAVEATIAGTATLETMLAVSPMYVVIGLSTVDAYLLARAQNATGRPSATDGTEAVSAKMADDDTVACPHCGNELDPDLEFCHWCTRAVDGLEESADR